MDVLGTPPGDFMSKISSESVSFEIVLENCVEKIN